MANYSFTQTAAQLQTAIDTIPKFISTTYTTTVSINANGGTTVDATTLGMVTPTGYAPFALGRTYISSATCLFRFINIDALEDGNNAIGLRNIGSSSVSNVSVEITVIYKTT